MFIMIFEIKSHSYVLSKMNFGPWLNVQGVSSAQQQVKKQDIRLSSTERFPLRANCCEKPSRGDTSAALLQRHTTCKLNDHVCYVHLMVRTELMNWKNSWFHIKNFFCFISLFFFFILVLLSLSFYSYRKTNVWLHTSYRMFPWEFYKIICRIIMRNKITILVTRTLNTGSSTVVLIGYLYCNTSHS